MTLIPYQTSDLGYNLMIVLNKDNIDRIERYDPAEIKLNNLADPFRSMILEQIHITYANDEDMAYVTSQVHVEGGLVKVLEHLTRGWEVKPQDHDQPQRPAHN